MSKLDGNERWKSKMLLTEHVERYDEHRAEGGAPGAAAAVQTRAPRERNIITTEERAMPYGADPQRDVIGFVDRLGPRRWRLVMPKPAFESQLDVMELVPQG